MFFLKSKHVFLDGKRYSRLCFIPLHKKKKENKICTNDPNMIYPTRNIVIILLDFVLATNGLNFFMILYFLFYICIHFHH
jgi:hypothetical protein